MKPVREVVSRDVIEDLWGAGYTILPRNRHPDPFFLPQDMIPATRSYQWWHLVEDRGFFGGTSGWSPVPASRHDGYFMPAGHVGPIEVSGLGLFEKPKFEVDAERIKVEAAARKQVMDWGAKTGEMFSGTVSFGDEVGVVGDPGLAKKVGNERLVDHKTKTIETTTDIPPDMIPHLSAVFAERDRLYKELIEVWETDGMVFTEQQYAVYGKYVEAAGADPSILKGPTLNALLLPQAIINVRQTLPTPPMQQQLRDLSSDLKEKKS